MFWFFSYSKFLFLIFFKKAQMNSCPMKIINTFFNWNTSIAQAFSLMSALLSCLCRSPFTSMAAQLVDLLLDGSHLCDSGRKRTLHSSLPSHLFSSSSTHCQIIVFYCGSPEWNSPVQMQPSTHEPVSYTAFRERNTPFTHLVHLTPRQTSQI